VRRSRTRPDSPGRHRLDLPGTAAGVLLALIVALSIAGPALAPHDPGFVRLDMINATPDAFYPLGGDGSGRDVLSRLLVAGGPTLTGALIAVLVSTVLGIASGTAAGWAGRGVDAVTGWIADAALALPSLIVLLALFRTLGSSMPLTMVVLGMLIAPNIHRLVRRLVIDARSETYVVAARASGLSSWQNLRRHVAGAVIGPLIVHVSVVAGIAVTLQSGLEFIGLGDPGVPTWGAMLASGFRTFHVSPVAAIWPGIMITLTVAALLLLGTSVRDALAPPRARPGRSAASRPSPPAGRATLPPARAPSDGAPLLQLRDLRVEHGGAEVVSGVDLSVSRGEIHALVGQSGAGKTQTAFAILGLLARGGVVSSGDVVFDGLRLEDLPPGERRRLLGRRIAYVPQEPMSNLDPSFRVGFQLVESLRASSSLSRRAARRRAVELLRRVGVVDAERVHRSFPHELSGGTAQRVLIACAVAGEPELLIADEPTSALDVVVQAEVLGLLRELQRERGLTMLLVTHDLGVVAELCDRASVMQGGRIVETADIASLFAAPQHPYTDALIAAARVASIAPPAADLGRESTPFTVSPGLPHPGRFDHGKGTIMTNSTPEQDAEAQIPTPTPSSGTDAGEFTAGTATAPEQAESAEDADPSEVPSTEELKEPSTEKEPSEEPKAPRRDDPEPDHQAVGIGVIDGPQTDTAP